MKYTIEMASDGMIYVSHFMGTSSGIQIILKLLPQQSEKEGFVVYGIEMA
jgi:hypothetical protein